MSYEVLVIGGGPAGLSAALNVRARGYGVLVVSNPPEESPLWKAERVENYLGLPGVTGADPADGDVSGVLTTQALASQLGDWVPWIMVVVIFFFGYSSILGAFAYAEANIVFLRGGTAAHTLAKIATVITTYIGAVAALRHVFILMDTAMALVTVVNLAGNA